MAVVVDENYWADSKWILISLFFMWVYMHFVSQFFFCALLTPKYGSQRMVSGVHKTSSNDGMRVLREVQRNLEKEYGLDKESISVTNLNRI